MSQPDQTIPQKGIMQRGCLSAVLICIALGGVNLVQAQEQSAPNSTGVPQVWMRTDGQRMSGNANLSKQFDRDRDACLELAKQRDNSVVTFKGCMAAKGYAMVPAAEAEKRLAAAAAAQAHKMQKLSDGAARSPKEQQMPNKQVLVTKKEDSEKSALTKVMKDAVAARHGGVLPKTMSEEDAEAAAQAAIKWKSTRKLEAMKVRPPPSNGTAEIYLAKEAIPKLMRDPGSAVFGDIFFVNDRKSATGYYVPVVCGTVNGKNGFGGMTGQKRFVAVMSDAIQGLWLEGTTPQDVFAPEWNSFCAGRHD